MNKNVLVISLLANVALVAALVGRPKAPAQPTDNRPEDSKPDVPRVVTKVVEGPTQILTETNTVRIDWSAIESPDYLKYIANLRAARCPEETIRDIVIADINKLYASRWRETQPTTVPWEYWRLRAKPPAKNADTALARHQLEIERAALIRELLGVDYDTEMSKYAWNPGGAREEALDFLPADKRLLVKDWQGRTRIELRQLTDQLKTEKASKETRATRIRELEAEQLRQLASALSPTELKEYHLRHSALADQLRRHLDALEPSEREFRQLFDILSASPDGLSQFVSLKGSDSPLTNPFLLPRLQETLGRETFEAFLASVEAPSKKEERRQEEEAAKVARAESNLALKQAMDEEIARIAADVGLTPEAREQQIKAIQREGKRLSAEMRKPGGKPRKKRK